MAAAGVMADMVMEWVAWRLGLLQLAQSQPVQRDKIATITATSSHPSITAKNTKLPKLMAALPDQKKVEAVIERSGMRWRAMCKCAFPARFLLKSPRQLIRIG